MAKPRNWPGNTDEMKARRNREKRVAKIFSSYNYTPLWANRLAMIFVELSESANERKVGVLGLIKRVLEGGSK